MQNANCKLQIGLVGVLCLTGMARADEPQAEFTLDTVRGRVVFLAEAMEKQAGAAAVPEAKDRILALETKAGELIPLLEDVRGRAFRRDERLRKMDVELLVRRYKGSPVVQVIRVFEVGKDGLNEVDYWCEICAIAMYELKECECCQGPIELRKRKSDGK
jgi:hypothetical protein